MSVLSFLSLVVYGKAYFISTPYDTAFKTLAEAMKKLALDLKYIGGNIGFMGPGDETRAIILIFTILCQVAVSLKTRRHGYPPNMTSFYPSKSTSGGSFN